MVPMNCVTCNVIPNTKPNCVVHSIAAASVHTVHVVILCTTLKRHAIIIVLCTRPWHVPLSRPANQFQWVRHLAWSVRIVPRPAVHYHSVQPHRWLISNLLVFTNHHHHHSICMVLPIRCIWIAAPFKIVRQHRRPPSVWPYRQPCWTTHVCPYSISSAAPLWWHWKICRCKNKQQQQQPVGDRTLCACLCVANNNINHLGSISISILRIILYIYIRNITTAHHTNNIRYLDIRVSSRYIYIYI